MFNTEIYRLSQIFFKKIERKKPTFQKVIILFRIFFFIFFCKHHILASIQKQNVTPSDESDSSKGHLLSEWDLTDVSRQRWITKIQQPELTPPKQSVSPSDEHLKKSLIFSQQKSSLEAQNHIKVVDSVQTSNFFEWYLLIFQS